MKIKSIRDLVYVLPHGMLNKYPDPLATLTSQYDTFTNPDTQAVLERTGIKPSVLDVAFICSAIVYAKQQGYEVALPHADTLC